MTWLPVVLFLVVAIAFFVWSDENDFWPGDEDLA